MLLTMSSCERPISSPLMTLPRNEGSSKSLGVWFRSLRGSERGAVCPGYLGGIRMSDHIWSLKGLKGDEKHISSSLLFCKNVFKNQCKHHFVHLHLLVYTNSKTSLVECNFTKSLCEKRGFFKVKYLRRICEVYAPFGETQSTEACYNFWGFLKKDRPFNSV